MDVIYDDLKIHFLDIHAYSFINSNCKSLFLCGQGNCNASFNSFLSYQRHLKNYHFQKPSQEPPQSIVHNEINDEVPTQPLIENEFNNAQIYDILSPANKSNTNIDDTVGTIFLYLKSRSGLTQTNINIFSQSMKDILIAFKNDFIKSANNVSDISPSIEHLVQIISKCKSNYSFKYVEPISILLGKRTEHRKHKNSFRNEEVEETFQYIPLIETLKSILLNKNMRENISTENSSNTSSFKSYLDTEEYKTSEYFKKYPNALRINLYYDEVELANPIGSKSGIHKVGVLYFTVQNLPEFINSSTQGIFILAVAYHLDIKKYGFCQVVVKCLNHLLLKLKNLKATQA